MSCLLDSLNYDAPHEVCGEARLAGHGGAIAKRRNDATDLVRRALRVTQKRQ